MIKEIVDNNKTLDFSKSVGDPMVEIGRLGLIEFCGKDKFESFEEMEEQIKKLFNLYVYKNAKTLNQVFSDNSKFTHNSTTNDSKKRLNNAIEFFKILINQDYDGYCLCCGSKDNLSNVEKMLFPLTSGDKNVNFTPYLSNNLLMCKYCMTSLFFIPINSQKVEWGKAFLISNNKDINKYWNEENIQLFNANLAKNIDIMPDSKTNIFNNFIYETIESLQEEELFGDITFYLFSNVDRNTKIEMVHIFKNQMQFIHKVAPKFFKDSLPTKDKDEWNYLIFKHLNKERKDDGKKITFEDEVIKNKNYKSTMKYFNPLIKNFIQGKSILYFLKKNHCSWHLTKIYLKEIQGMREERLIVLKKIAEKLQELNSGDKEFISKIVFPLERTKSQSEFREKLRELMRKFLTKSNDPLFTADEMVFQILPSGESWTETKDILLIALYEKLTLDDEIKEEFEKHITNEGESEDE